MAINNVQHYSKKTKMFVQSDDNIILVRVILFSQICNKRLAA